MTDFNPQPTLHGDTLTLRPLHADDFDALYSVASDPLIWEQHPSPLRYQREVFEQEVFAPGLSSANTLVVIDTASGAVLGASRYYDLDAAQRELAIGYTFLARNHWGGATNGELKRLMLTHAFGWAQRVWFHIGANNMRSRRALEKIGGKLHHMAMRDSKAGAIEYAYYAMDRKEFRL